MSKTEKSVLIRKIASELGEELSEDQLNNAMRIISSSINQYEVEPSAGALYSIDNNELIGAYLSAKEIEGRSKKTIERYRYCINRLETTMKYLVIAEDNVRNSYHKYA